jgi:hypothetical protein
MHHAWPPVETLLLGPRAMPQMCMSSGMAADSHDVAVTIHVCCNCMFQMFQKYIAGVLFEYFICCNGYIHKLQAYVSNISHVSNVCCSMCFMLQVFSLVGTRNECRQRWSPRACATAWHARYTSSSRHMRAHAEH